MGLVVAPGHAASSATPATTSALLIGSRALNDRTGNARLGTDQALGQLAAALRHRRQPIGGDGLGRRARARREQRDARHDQRAPHRLTRAIASISTRAALGSAAAWIVVRAGLCAPKCFA